jgi:hypothetical protein
MLLPFNLHTCVSYTANIIGVCFKPERSANIFSDVNKCNVAFQFMHMCPLAIIVVFVVCSESLPSVCLLWMNIMQPSSIYTCFPCRAKSNGLYFRSQRFAGGNSGSHRTSKHCRSMGLLNQKWIYCSLPMANDGRAQRKWDLSWWSFLLCVTRWLSPLSKYNVGFSFLHIYFCIAQGNFFFMSVTRAGGDSVGDLLAGRHH